MTRLMINQTLKKTAIAARVGGCVVVLALLSGCRSPQEYKEQADKTVYETIDQKWQDGFGSKANYKISDVPSDPNDIQPTVRVPESKILTIPQAVEIATANNRPYQLERELLYLSALNLQLVRHVYELQPFGGAAADYTKTGDDESTSAGTFLGFNKLLASGALLTTNVTAAWTEILTGDQRSGFRTFFNSTITQPLLRGRDSRVVMENLTQAERDTIYQIRFFNRFRQTYVVSVISEYYLVLLQMELLKNAETNLRLIDEIGRQTEILVKAGRLPSYELDRVNQDKIEAQDLCIDTEEDYKQSLDAFKLTLAIPITTELTLDENELVGVKMPGVESLSDLRSLQADSPKDLSSEVLDMLEAELVLYDPAKPGGSRMEAGLFSEAEAYETAMALRLDLANKADAIEDAERKVFVAADSLRAGLNLTGATSLSTRGSSDSSAGVGMQLDLPLDRVAEANVYRTALITLNQKKREYQEGVDTVTLEIRQAYWTLVETEKRYQVQLEGLELAKKRYTNTLQLMYYGRANSRRVLDAQEALLKAQNGAVEAHVKHAIAMLEFYRDSGVLQVRPDGMWEK
jgi:outer membrane protein TolC